MKILVIDVETTALYPKDGELVEIGGILLDMETGERKTLINMVIKPKGDFDQDAWIFNNSDLTPELVLKGKSISILKKEIKELLSEYPVIAYNSDFDFGWLSKYGIRPKIKILEDPMFFATNILQIPRWDGSYKWPSVQECMDFFKIAGFEPHRAALDADIEAQIIFRLVREYNMKLN